MEQKYRKLEMGDTIQDGDEVWEFGCGPWGPVSKIEHGQQYRNGYNEMRRPVAAEETIDDVREAWQKDHMEMKWKLDAVVAERMGIERMWFKQRDELSDSRNRITDLTKERDELKKWLDETQQEMAERYFKGIENERSAKNQITDLTRRLEDALSDKVIAEKSEPLEKKITALQKDLEKSRRDLMSETDFGLRSRVKLTEERDEAIAEIKRLRANSVKEQSEYEKRCDLFHKIEKAFYDGSDAEAFVAALRKRLA